MSFTAYVAGVVHVAKMEKGSEKSVSTVPHTKNRGLETREQSVREAFMTR